MYLVQMDKNNCRMRYVNIMEQNLLHSPHTLTTLYHPDRFNIPNILYKFKKANHHRS